MKIHCTKSAFSYLEEKQSIGSKGKTIKYGRLRMADYLLSQAYISLKDQWDIFLIRCHTNPLGANRGMIEYCETSCREILDNAHIFKCIVLNGHKGDYSYDFFLNGYTREMKKNTY